MGLFDRIFKPRQMKIDSDTTFKTLTAYEPVFTSWKGKLYESELCRSAIDTVARHVSKLKVEMVGSAQPQLKTMIKHKPNPWMTWSQFLYRCASILYATNTLFICPLLSDDASMETVGFYPVLPSRATLREINGKIWVRYQFRNGKIGAIEYDRCAVLTRYQYESDFFGDPNNALDDTMNLVHLNSQAVKTAMKDSASFRFFAKLNNFSKSSDLKKEQERFTKAHFSAEASQNGILLFPNTYTDITPINSKPYTVDDKQMSYIRSNIERYFGVNEKVITNSATNDEMDAFFNGAIEPFAIQLSEALSKAIYTDLERSYGSYVLVSANRLQYMSTTSKVAMAKELGDRGMLTINEMRELFNYPPIPDGDVSVIRGEYYNLEDKIGGTDEQETN